MPKKSKVKYPKCHVCGRKAQRWDGGVQAVSFDSKAGKFVTTPVECSWICKKHDPRHKWFDLPDDLAGALQDIVCLREALNDLHRKTFEAVARDRVAQRLVDKEQTREEACRVEA